MDSTRIVDTGLKFPRLLRIPGGYRRPRSEYDHCVLEEINFQIRLARAEVSTSKFLPLKADLFAWLLKNGRFYSPNALPNSYRIGEEQACFKNSQERIFVNNNLVYVEGFGFYKIAPHHHAWCCDRKGRVIDTTWHGRGDETQSGLSYFGVVIHKSCVRNAILATFFYDAVLDVDTLTRVAEGRFRSLSELSEE